MSLENSSASLLQQALAAHQKGAFQQAAMLYGEVLKQDPHNADAFHLMGLIFQQNNDHTKAIEWITNAIDLAPNTAFYMVNLANSLRALHHLDQAEAYLRKALQIEPSLADAHFNLGNVLLERGDVATAQRCFTSAIRLDPNNHQALLNLALSLEKTAQYQQAIPYYQRLSQESGESRCLGQLGLARCYLGANDLLTAQSHAEKVLQDQDSGLEQLIEAAKIILKLPQSAQDVKIIPILQAVRQQHPEDERASLLLASLLLERRDLPFASQIYEELSCSDSPSSAALIGLGDCALSQEHYDRAEQAYDRAISLYPNDPIAQVRKGQLLVRFGTMLTHIYRYDHSFKTFDEAATFFNHALTQAPNNSEALHGLASIALFKGEFAKTVTLEQQAIANDPELVPAYHYLSLAYQYLGDLEKAEDISRKLLSLTSARPNSLSVRSVQRAITHIARWQGKLDDVIIYQNDPIDSGAELGPLASAHYAQSCGTLAMAVIADHNFSLALMLSYQDLPQSGEVTLLETPTPKIHRNSVLNPAYALRIFIKDRQLFLSMGDGKSWSVCDHQPLASPLETHGELSLKLTRVSSQIRAYLNTEPVFEKSVPPSYRLPGDCLNIDRGIPGQNNRYITLQGLALRIQNYKRESVAPRKRIDLFSVFYGDMFARLMHHTMLPSLMLESNVPALQKKYDVIHNIYCTKAEVPLLKQHFHQLDKANIPWSLNTDILDDTSDWTRNLIYRPVIDQVYRALENDALIVFTPPDHVFGPGLAQAVEKMAPLEYLLVGHPRINMEAAYPVLRDLMREDDYAAKLDQDFLIDFAINQYPHFVTTTGMDNPDEFWWNGRKVEDSYRIRFKEPPPLAFYPSLDIINIIESGTAYAPAFETIDHDIPDLMDRMGRLRCVENAEEFFWVEYCKMTRNVPTIRNTFWSPTAQRLAKTELVWKMGKNK